MLLKYNRENVLAIHVIHDGHGQKKVPTTMTENKGRALGAKIVRFVPGLNKMDDKDWDKVKNHPKIEYLIDEDFLEVVAAGDLEDPELEGCVDLQEYLAADAVKLVKKCFDKDLLEKWEKEEGRVTVLKQVEKQLKALELTPAELEAMKQKA